jgi:hypothetical protein
LFGVHPRKQKTDNKERQRKKKVNTVAHCGRLFLWGDDALPSEPKIQRVSLLERTARCPYGIYTSLKMNFPCL